MHLNRIREDREERRITVLLYAGTIVLLLVLLYATYANIIGYQHVAAEVRKENSALVELEAMLSALRDQEIGVRDYLFTGDTTFLQPYDEAIPPYELHHLRAAIFLTDTVSRRRLTEMNVRGVRLREEWARMVAEKVPGTAIQPVEEQRLQKAKGAMERLRIGYDLIMGEHRARRDRLLATQRTSGVDAPAMLILYSLLAITATAILFWRLNRAMGNGEMARMKLSENLAELDHEVKTRTDLQNMLQQVLDSSPSGIMSFKAVRGADGRIADFKWLSSNDQANSIVGRDDLVGERLLEVLPTKWTSGLFEHYVHVVEHGKPSIQQFHYETEDIDKWFRMHAVKLDDGFVMTFIDITEEQRAEENNLESERLELTGQITRTVAHEVRNPLTNIHLAVEQLHDEVQDRQDQVQPFFQIIGRNLERIGTLIREMLESSRKRELKLGPCALEDVVRAVSQAVQDRLELKSMRSTIDIEGDLPRVMADQALLVLAITNIAVNAVEAMEPGKGVLSMSVQRQGDALLLEVADNGMGIPPENIQRLYEPFYSGRPGGVGLGLTTTRSILSSHRINLDVRSTVGRGTTFVLRFPEEMVL